MANGILAASQLEMLTLSGTGVITIVPPNTNTNRTLTLPDATGTVLTTATAGVPVNGPAFSAYSSASQSLANNTAVKLQFNVEEFDTNSCFDSTTNYRFTPTVAGYYQISGAANCSANAINTRFLRLYKNGSNYKEFQAVATNATNFMTLSGSALVYFNGSTDYVELYIVQNSGSTLTTGGSQSEVWFTGAMVRSAV
jgi:hypothetical protein